MQIHGLAKTTLLDFPGHVAASVFFGHCNFRCPFCHNMNLVLNPDADAVYTPDEILAFLRSRKNILDGVCITGGEPTLEKDLVPFIQEIKKLNLLVKLDTNGYLPDTIKELLDLTLIDYIAMDLKASPDRYALASGVKELDITKINSSISIIMDSDIPYEFRTTVVKELHDAESFKQIGTWINGASHYYLQSFKNSEYVPNQSLHAYEKKDLLVFKELLSSYVSSIELRGID
ncbi:MAG: anaerobic ribonucleoside-triphosphate reductase activating protein [Clostridia bacterium]|nr:anaerobic ribonucleoside-triphosphate reductase activating protein [Clostridia bacterium]